ncbi:slit3 protein-like [Tropilaelaps mercedesae]|uniref:Slit3 protein-like n=1 Tax=Tropilaelaps mercedesae TaxID=418985 RepID=A0A1V9XEM0_9ACAR|nr:slit3 protein-like [Tropilaelaps mercedesae]
MDTMRKSVAVIQCILFMCITQSAGLGARYVRPEDCTWEPVPDSVHVSMTCSVRKLEGSVHPTNFSLIMPNHTEKLTIYCTDDQRAVQTSQMANRSFEHLHGLRSLTIERCKFSRLPAKAFEGLDNLTHLAIKTFTTDSRHHTSLRVSPSSLAPLENIESLDLSENNMESLTAELLCGLDRLRLVNLSKNAFSDVLSLGFSSNSHCKPAIRNLEISHNKIGVLPDSGIASLVHLKELLLNHNQITRVESGSFLGLSQLERLDITHNMLVVLPAGLFQTTPRLSELYMRNNSLGAFLPGIFIGLEMLTILDLAHNQLTSLEWLGESDSRVRLTQLKVLDLSNNRLTRLDARAFATLTGLQALHLQDNLIEFIGESTFVALNDLQTLVLSRNYLKALGPSMMVGLRSVATLQLDNNRLETVHPSALTNVSHVQELNIAGNKLSNVPDGLSSLAMLRSLDLSHNNIRDVTNASYQSLNQLYALNLMDNKISNLSQGAFDDLPSVRILNLARNGIHSIEQGTFDDVPGLHYLRLDANSLEDVNGLFGNLHDLIMLNVSVNRIRWFDYALIPVGLQWLDIHDNQIEALGNYFELEQSLKLRTLDASFNKLIDLDSSSLPNGIEIVYLRNNSVRRIQPFTFLGKRNLSRVDLSNNRLATLEMTAFRLSEVPLRRPLPEFAIAGNPYMCNCHMEWLQRLQNPGVPSSHDDLRQYPRIVDLHSVECNARYPVNGYLLPLTRMKSSQFLCEYTSHCFSLCHCCDFDLCDCEVVCPVGCTCYHDQLWNTNIVVCSSRQQSDIPRKLPMDVSAAYFDGNSIAHLTPHSLAGRRNMKVLYLNGSNVETMENRTFSGLPELRILRLDNNHISQLHGHEFDGLVRLQELYLTNNRLRHLGNTTFVNLRNLEVLHLDRNYLIEISVWSLQQNLHLTEIRMANNPWTCDCHFTANLAQFLHERGDKVADIFQLSCVHNETTALPLWEVNVTECHSSTDDSFSAGQHQFQHIGDFVPMFFVLAVFLLLVGMAILMVTFYRRQVSVWFFSRYGVRMFRRTTIEEEKLFDAFVSYSKKDEAFVAQILAPELECGNPPYRLCLHYRDLPMVTGYLSEAIEEAVESSRRTIVILSEHFLKSEWCRYEFKSAHHEVLSNSNFKLVAIFLGRVSYRDLDPDIRMWLKRSTFLHWGEKNFWDKLRYSLPDARNRKIMRSDLNSVAVHI